jgi:hypothetical protein
MASPRRWFAVCVRNDSYEASLERRKIYQVLADADAARHGPRPLHQAAARAIVRGHW